MTIGLMFLNFNSSPLFWSLPTTQVRKPPLPVPQVLDCLKAKPTYPICQGKYEPFPREPPKGGFAHCSPRIMNINKINIIHDPSIARRDGPAAKGAGYPSKVALRRLAKDG